MIGALGQYPSARATQTDAANLVPLGRGLDPRHCGIAGAARGLAAKTEVRVRGGASEQDDLVPPQSCPALHRGGSQG